MLESLLCLACFCVEPGLLDRPKSAAPLTIPTCDRPAAKLVIPATVHVKSPVRLTEADREIFAKWEAATRKESTWNRSQREEFRRGIQREFNQHAAIAAEQVIGSVKASRLLETFDWKVLDQTTEWIFLEATPLEEVERLFYGAIRVRLSLEYGSLEQIVVVGRNRTIKTVWEAEPPSILSEIRVISFQDEVPPAPKVSVRTADARVD